MDVGKFSMLLDDSEVRVIVYGLGHVYPAEPTASGPQRLLAAVGRLVETADPGQVESWLSDESANSPITVEQITAAYGDRVIGDLARYAGSEPTDVSWQLTVVLPDLVDVVTPGGVIVDATELRAAFINASDAADRSAGPFA